MTVRGRTMETAVAAAVAGAVGAVAVPKTGIRTWTAITTTRTKAPRTMTTPTPAKAPLI
jgi:transcription initiation factor TFIIIB Brf1 subunit/transcription initiation factor TFIIB